MLLLKINNLLKHQYIRMKYLIIAYLQINKQITYLNYICSLQKNNYESRF